VRLRRDLVQDGWVQHQSLHFLATTSATIAAPRHAQMSAIPPAHHQSI
jgi:hypothetical protein